MHHRTVNEPNHVAHLLATVFCCLIWLPFWLLLTILNSLEHPRWFCSQCGHAAGELTPEQAHTAHLASQHAKEQQAVHRAERKNAMDDRMGRWADGIMEFYANTGAEIPRVPGRIDALLKASAGEGNEILHWFFRVAFVVLVVGVLGWIGWRLGERTIDLMSP